MKLVFALEFLLAVHTAVNTIFLIGQFEAMWQFLFDRSDAAWVFAFNDVGNKIRKSQNTFLYDLIISDNVDRDVLI